jgi:hypothetical protein
MLYQIVNQRNGNSPNKVRYKKALSNNGYHQRNAKQQLLCRNL